MNSTQFQLSRVVGPALAGVAFRLFGLAGCFFANGLSFIAVVASLRVVRPQPFQRTSRHAVGDRKAFWHDLTEGFRYVRNRPRVSALLLLSGVNSLFGAPYFTLVPIYARDIFHLGETGLAVMMGTAGAGASLGALLVAYLGDFRRKGWLVLGGAILFGVFIASFGMASRLTFSLAFLFGIGFSLVVCVATINTLLQKLVTDEMRGRVMSMFILSFMGTMPVGNIVAGTVSNHVGPQYTLATGGLIVALFATGVMIFNRRLRDLH
jgi:predicted MFS family arabinose efflux permease